MKENSSIESWVLMSLIHRDLDDGDYLNALFLSERLFAINTHNSYYRFLYATSLIHTSDHSASHMLLREERSIHCLNLFAKSCLALSHTEQDKERKRSFLEEGVQAVSLALKDSPDTINWTDELASVKSRHHIPNRSSLYILLGDLYVKMDNIRAAAKAYMDCLNLNPYKISAYLKLCDIAPDVTNFEKAKLPEDIFKDFLPQALYPSTDTSMLPPLPSSMLTEITFEKKKLANDYAKNHYSMPDLSMDFQKITLHQLRTMITYKPEIAEEYLEEGSDRGEIELRKDILMDTVNNDIKAMEEKEKYRNKHGLHKLPPEEAPSNLDTRLPFINIHNEFLGQESEKREYDSIELDQKASLYSNACTYSSSRPNKRQKYLGEESIPQDETISQIFLPTFKGTTFISEETNVCLVEGMNRVVRLLRVIASGYLCQSFYQSAEAVAELKQLDINQYESARVLGILGKAYYDVGDYPSARLFFRKSFYIAPWYCEYTPFYSTCLWYLQKEGELNLLAYKMKNNQCHLYEAYIALGNWAKCGKEGGDATYWFKKAVSTNPDHFYAYALLGHEDWERENYLGSKQHFAKSMLANKRSYLGWFGLANAYRAMDENVQSETLLREAVRLHPGHPVLLATLAEVLYLMKEYEEAKEFIDRSLYISPFIDYEQLKEKISEELNKPLAERV